MGDVPERRGRSTTLHHTSPLPGEMYHGMGCHQLWQEVSPGSSRSIFTGQRYLDKILHPHIAKHLNYLGSYGQRHALAVEYGAPIHWRKTLRPFRAQLKINNFPHPAYSPDLNPIENMWAIIKARLRRKKRAPTSQEDLWEAIKEEWDAIPISTVNKLIMSMPKRVEKLKKNRGWGISY